MNLNQITIPSLDVEKAIDFYEKIGLHLIVKDLPHYVRFMCKEGNATFSIHEVEKLPKGEGVIVYFEDNDLDNTIHSLIQKGITIDELPEDKDWLWREARLKDLDGNQLIIYYAGDNRLNPPWRIN
jgi:catechol 2,3-dioxygenase-like lactoylglutathione lyase family enzyme